MRSRPLPRLLRLAALALSLTVAGCSDALAVVGLTNLTGYWEGYYGNDLDFFLDLDDDLYGVYGVGGLRRGDSRVDYYVDGERDGGHLRIYADDGWNDDPLIFEGRITGEDRMDGWVYLELLPERVTLRRR